MHTRHGINTPAGGAGLVGARLLSERFYNGEHRGAAQMMLDCSSTSRPGGSDRRYPPVCRSRRSPARTSTARSGNVLAGSRRGVSGNIHFPQFGKNSRSPGARSRAAAQAKRPPRTKRRLGALHFLAYRSPTMLASGFPRPSRPLAHATKVNETAALSTELRGRNAYFEGIYVSAPAQVAVACSIH